MLVVHSFNLIWRDAIGCIDRYVLGLIMISMQTRHINVFDQPKHVCTKRKHSTYVTFHFMHNQYQVYLVLLCKLTSFMLQDFACSCSETPKLLFL